MKQEFEDYIEKTLARLSVEIEALQKWFKQDFPESRLEVNLDLNKIHRLLTIQVRILMGQEMVQNRGAFYNKVMIPEKDLSDPLFMDGFLRLFNEKYRQEISRAINIHYHNERAKEASGEAQEFSDS